VRLPCLTAMMSVLAAAACGGSDLMLPTGTGPAEIAVVHGADQEGPAGGELSESLVVRLVDTSGAGVEGRQVEWVVLLGGGQTDPDTSTTDADGFAWTRWTLGREPGANAIRAMVPEVGFVTFSAVGTEAPEPPPNPEPPPGPEPSRIEPAAGNGQTATVGSAVPVPPAVRVTDDQGDPAPGVAVRFVVTAGGGAVDGGAATTDADGIATVGSWRLGATPGGNALEARAEGLDGSPVVFTAQGTAAPSAGVDHFVFRLQPHDVEPGETFRVEVAMVDAVGNVVDLSGILIYIALFEEGDDSPENDRLSGERFRATDHGVAVFDGLAVTERGRYRIRALSDQLPELGPHGPEPFLFSLPFDVR
jgi:hypothetical protein